MSEPVVFESPSIKVYEHDDGVLELSLDLADEKVNKLGQKMLAELDATLTELLKKSHLRALVMSSAKASFCVGADIVEFIPLFKQPQAQLMQAVAGVQQLYNKIEDLPIPTVVAIHGDCMGGATELALAGDFRILSEDAKVALPEVKLGILPGWGGSVRLPRLLGLDTALEWMCTGNAANAEQALKDGFAQAVVSREQLRRSAVATAQRAAAGELDWQTRRSVKQAPLALPKIEQALSFQAAKGLVGAKAGPNFPAPLTIIKTIATHAPLAREAALEVELKAFAGLAQGSVAESLVGLFMKGQMVKRIAKHYQKTANPVQQAAVLGAGIMGGGIAYQCASTGTRVLLKDINEKALQQGIAEADKLLFKQVGRGKISQQQAAEAMHAIHPTLSFAEFAQTDIVIEAVTENPKLKAQVLAETEQALPTHAILTSNTSTISISQLAQNLQRPEQFCGLHFFNPVHRMPLVEIIRGAASSEQTIATAVTFAQSLKKTPIVVNDCPGFLVNRVLFPYYGGFDRLMQDGVDYRRIDKIMQGFGWPMGPAYLADVIGLDTMNHAGQVLATGYPDRMAGLKEGLLLRLFNEGRLGQKNGRGFYQYQNDRRGKPKKSDDSEAVALIQAGVTQQQEVSDEQIVQRMMLALCLECARCLEQKIVATPAELDMALIYGIGFPAHLGGACHYMDQLGLANVVALADTFAGLSPLYQAPEGLRAMAAAGERYFPLP